MLELGYLFSLSTLLFDCCSAHIFSVWLLQCISGETKTCSVKACKLTEQPINLVLFSAHFDGRACQICIYMVCYLLIQSFHYVLLDVQFMSVLCTTFWSIEFIARLDFGGSVFWPQKIENTVVKLPFFLWKDRAFVLSFQPYPGPTRATIFFWLHGKREHTRNISLTHMWMRPLTHAQTNGTLLISLKSCWKPTRLLTHALKDRNQRHTTEIIKVLLKVHLYVRNSRGHQYLSSPACA